MRTLSPGDVSNCSIMMSPPAGPPTGRRTDSDGKKTPEIIAVIEDVLAHDIAGDPMSALRWSRRTTEKTASLLAACGIAVSANTVARLLHDINFSLPGNHKELATSCSTDRNLQFDCIADLRERFQ